MSRRVTTLPMHVFQRRQETSRFTRVSRDVFVPCGFGPECYELCCDVKGNTSARGNASTRGNTGADVSGVAEQATKSSAIR